MGKLKPSEYKWCENRREFVDKIVCEHAKWKCEDCKYRKDPPVKKED